MRQEFRPLHSSPARAPRLLIVLAVAWLATFAAPAFADAPRNVLVIYSHGRLLPGNLDIERGLSAGFATRPEIQVAPSYEILDSSRFGGPEFERVLVAYLRDKYALRPPEVVIAANNQALDLVTRNRAVLFPGVPIVHMGVSAEYLRSLPALPSDVVGTPIQHDFLGTVEQARRWHPQARRLVVVTGTTSWDREWETRLRAETSQLAPGLAVEFLAGLSTPELTRRLGAIPADSIVYTPGFFRDGADRQYEPREAARVIAAAAPAPVYGPFESFVGTGAVGGRTVSYVTVGRIAAETALQLLDGRPPASLQVPGLVPTPLRVDWRQLQRWGIPEGAVRPDTDVQFREPSLWQAHRDKVLLGILVILLQAGLIATLLLERRARQRTASTLARSEEHMRLAAIAAGLSSWVLDDDDARDRRRAPHRADSAHPAMMDFRATLAKIAPQDRLAVDAALREARATNGEFEVEYRVESPDGSWRWQAARGRADATQPGRLLGVAIDVTQRKLAEIQAEQDRVALQHMSRVSMLGQLSASIAHQLNQPLASILGNAEAAQKMLHRDPVDLAELREICTDIVAQNHHAAQVIRRLSVLFKRGEPLFEPLDVNEMVRDTIELTRSMLTMRHVTALTQLAPDLAPVSGDRVQLQQLLLNLVVNACDAVAELPDDRRVVTIRTAAEADGVHLCVTDRGPGVPSGAADRLFEPFWSTKPRGMGMGLAVCRSIAEAHRGTLTAGNAPGGGADFCLRMPGVSAARAPASAVALAGAASSA